MIRPWRLPMMHLPYLPKEPRLKPLHFQSPLQYPTSSEPTCQFCPYSLYRNCNKAKGSGVKTSRRSTSLSCRTTCESYSAVASERARRFFCRCRGQSRADLPTNAAATIRNYSNTTTPSRISSCIINSISSANRSIPRWTCSPGQKHRKRANHFAGSIALKIGLG